MSMMRTHQFLEKFIEMTKQHYVLCYARPDTALDWPEVLVIEKKRPAWQEGRWNLPGGKIEKGETASEAASRELFEETGIRAVECTEHGKIVTDNSVVHCMYCEFDGRMGVNQLEQKTDEHVSWVEIDNLVDNDKMFSNLRTIIPLMDSYFDGWIMRPSGEGWIIENPGVA